MRLYKYSARTALAEGDRGACRRAAGPEKGESEHRGGLKSHARPPRPLPKRGTEKPTGEHHGGSKSRTWPPTGRCEGALRPPRPKAQTTQGQSRRQHAGTHTDAAGARTHTHEPQHKAQTQEGPRASAGERVAEII